MLEGGPRESALSAAYSLRGSSVSGDSDRPVVVDRLVTR
jgi:hypothetical protein